MHRLRPSGLGHLACKTFHSETERYRFLSTLSSLAQACSDAVDLRQYKTAKRSSAKYVLRSFAT
jgi:hypothetical protein